MALPDVLSLLLRAPLVVIGPSLVRVDYLAQTMILPPIIMDGHIGITHVNNFGERTEDGVRVNQFQLAVHRHHLGLVVIEIYFFLRHIRKV